MLSSEIDTLLKPHRDKLAELEQEAGVEKQADRAREGSMFPLGIDGERVDPEEYFADEADYTRRGIRQAYFCLFGFHEQQLQLNRRGPARRLQRGREDATQVVDAPEAIPSG